MEHKQEDSSPEASQDSPEASLLAERTEMPPEAEMSYRGPNPAGQAILRASLFGGAGWFVGNAIGRLGSKPPEFATDKYNQTVKSFKARNLGGLLAFVGGVMGIYGGLKDTRLYRDQVREMQEALKGQHGILSDCRDELKLQLKGKGNLTHYDPEWEKGAEEEEEAAKPEAPQTESPETEIEAESLKEATLEAQEKGRG